MTQDMLRYDKKWASVGGRDSPEIGVIRALCKKTNETLSKELMTACSSPEFARYVKEPISQSFLIQFFPHSYCVSFSVLLITFLFSGQDEMLIDNLLFDMFLYFLFGHVLYFPDW